VKPVGQFMPQSMDLGLQPSPMTPQYWPPGGLQVKQDEASTTLASLPGPMPAPPVPMVPPVPTVPPLPVELVPDAPPPDVVPPPPPLPDPPGRLGDGSSPLHAATRTNAANARRLAVFANLIGFSSLSPKSTIGTTVAVLILFDIAIEVRHIRVTNSAPRHYDGCCGRCLTAIRSLSERSRSSGTGDFGAGTGSCPLIFATVLGAAIQALTEAAISIAPKRQIDIRKICMATTAVSAAKVRGSWKRPRCLGRTRCSSPSCALASGAKRATACWSVK
jgi:hypothetical protein